MSDATATTHEFKAEVAAVLRLVTNSLYTNREVFLRELVSNASDALDKARFAALVDKDLRDQELEPFIQIIADKSRGVLVIEDVGIGMTAEEATQNLGTIAHSGTLRFLEQVAAEEAEGKRPNLNLIGQFGVGFYSAFMVADRIDVHTLSARPGHEPVCWSSDGGKFELRPSPRRLRGTRIELHLKPEAREFLERYRLESVIRKYSNYVMHPIRVQVTDKEGKEDEEKQVNEATAFWMRPAKELTEEPDASGAVPLGQTANADRRARDALAGCDLRGALTALIEGYGDAIYSYCYRVLRSRAAADDVYQTVFVQAYQHLPGFAGDSFRPWLYTIAATVLVMVLAIP